MIIGIETLCRETPNTQIINPNNSQSISDKVDGREGNSPDSKVRSLNDSK